jgi:hypothetical protein
MTGVDARHETTQRWLRPAPGTWPWIAVGLFGNTALEGCDLLRHSTAIRQAWPLLTGSAPNALAVFAIGARRLRLVGRRRDGRRRQHAGAALASDHLPQSGVA